MLSLSFLRRATSFALAGVAVATVTAIAVEYGRYQKVRDEHDPEYNQTRADIISLRERPPAGLEQGCWSSAVNLTHNAYCETFYLTLLGRRAVDMGAFHRFGEAFRERMGREPGPELLEWAWDELARSGPRGKFYLDKRRALLRANLTCGNAVR